MSRGNHDTREKQNRGEVSVKSTGIVRKVDELGRIVLPIELRRTLDIAERVWRSMWMAPRWY